MLVGPPMTSRAARSRSIEFGRLLVVKHAECIEILRRPEHLPLARGAIVRRQDYKRIVPLAEFLEGLTDSPDALVDCPDHRRVDFHVAGEQALLVRRQFVPRLDVVAGLAVAGRKLGAGRNDAELDLLLEPRGANRVPAQFITAAVPLDILALGMQRRVYGRMRKIKEDRLGRIRSFRRPDHRYRAIGEIVGQIIAVRIAFGCDLRLSTINVGRMMIVGEGLEEAVEPVEAALHRPRGA